MGRIEMQQARTQAVQAPFKTKSHQQPKMLVGLSFSCGKAAQNGMLSSQQHQHRYPQYTHVFHPQVTWEANFPDILHLCFMHSQLTCCGSALSAPIFTKIRAFDAFRSARSFCLCHTLCLRLAWWQELSWSLCLLLWPCGQSTSWFCSIWTTRIAR